ncbi:MAG: hypothetical protein WDW38_004909 [Sanguina aurantia]
MDSAPLEQADSSEPVAAPAISERAPVTSILPTPSPRAKRSVSKSKPAPSSSVAPSTDSTSAPTASANAPPLVRRPTSSPSIPSTPQEDLPLPAVSLSQDAATTDDSSDPTSSLADDDGSEEAAPGRKLFARRRLRSSSVSRSTPAAALRQAQAAPEAPSTSSSAHTSTPEPHSSSSPSAQDEPPSSSSASTTSSPTHPERTDVSREDEDEDDDESAAMDLPVSALEQPARPSKADAASTLTPGSATKASKASTRLSPKGRSVRPPGPKTSSASKYVELRESSPMYQPALTDEDLEEDPEGHRSGFVAVIGRPNAGKSTLINALVGQKLSIVSYKPQTTRHRIMGIASAAEYQMIIFDTPGIIENKRTKLEERMMAAVVSSIQNSEAIIAVVDCMDDPRGALEMFQPGDNWQGPPMAVLLNKTDLVGPIQLANIKAWYTSTCRAEAVFDGSALEKTGVDELKAWAVSKMPEGPTLYPKGIVSEQPERFFVSECIREQIFSHYDQDIPYCTQVVVKEFTERPSVSGGIKSFISALIMVEKDSQKAILIGKGGNMLKSVGSNARREIETFLDRPVYLELQVQVSKGWRDSKDALTKFGYFDANLI